MKRSLLAMSLLLYSGEILALTPPHGKSLRQDRNYLNIDVPTGSLITPGTETSIEGSSKRRLSFDANVKEEKASVVKLKKKATSKETLESSKQNRESDLGSSNLPSYYQGINLDQVQVSDQVVYVAKTNRAKLKGLKSGDMLRAVIEQEIKASSQVVTPIRAIVLSPLFKGAFLLGVASLDRELKRVLFSFSKIRLPESDEVYLLKATGLSRTGSVGLEGEYQSQAGKFFVAELASATAAGLVDAGIQRQQTGFGGYIQEPSYANAVKQGAVSAMGRSTERMAEAYKHAPEFTEIQGFQEIQVLIQEDPTASE